MFSTLQINPSDLLSPSEGKLLNFRLIETSKFSLTVWDAIIISIITLTAFFVLKLIKNAIFRNKNIDTGKQHSLYNLTKYVIIVITFLWVLQSLGMNLTLLMGGSAALLVGVGLGLQNMFSDFVSGIILLADSSIRVGDVIEVNGLVCEVSRIRLRTTEVLTRDDKYILLPNTQLTKIRLSTGRTTTKNRVST